METIYFDHLSGSPLHPDVREAMIRYLQTDGHANPTSQHRLGDRAAETLEQARRQVAALIHAQPPDIVFTSGGTESINAAIKGVAFAMGKKGRHIVTSNVEHQSVLRSLRMLLRLGYEVTSLPVDRHGLVDPGDVARAIKDSTILVTIMHGNNEIGTLEPIAEIGRITRERNVMFHTDAVASTGVVPVDVDEMGVDLLSMAANQFYGPPGVGALYIRPKSRIVPFLDGGIQENNRRAGTQNMVGIVGMGRAASLARQEMATRTAHLSALRAAFLERLAKIGDVSINGHTVLCLPNLISASVSYVEGESLMLLLDEEGVFVSTRSACATGSLRTSHVLIATGVDYATAQGTVLFSFGMGNTMDELDRAFAALERSVAFLRKMSPIGRK